MNVPTSFRHLVGLPMVLLLGGSASPFAAPQDPSPAAAQAAPEAVPLPTPRPPLPSRNVRVTVTLTDQLGTSAPVVRTALLTIADGRQGLVRSGTTVRRTTPAAPGQVIVGAGDVAELPLSVDAVVDITPSNAILLKLGFNYRVYGSPARDGANIEVVRRDLTENLTVLLESGSTLVVSESADAISDRKVKVEVQAEILP